MTPLLLIVGCGRSGTTLLRAILDSHSELAVPGEAPFIPRALERQVAYVDRRGNVNSHALLADIAKSRFFATWGLDPRIAAAHIEAARPRTVADALRGLYFAYAQSQDKHRYADKTPSNVLKGVVLGKAFPEAQFLHLVRDPRDVVASHLRLGWYDSVHEAALNWAVRVKEGFGIPERIGATRYSDLRYEDFVRHPDWHTRNICESIGLQFEPEMLERYRKNKHVARTMLFPEAHHRLGEPIRDYSSWQTSLTENEVAVIEAICQEAMRLAGYQPVTRAKRLDLLTVGYHRTRARLRWHSRRFGRRVKRKLSAKRFY